MSLKRFLIIYLFSVSNAVFSLKIQLYSFDLFKCVNTRKAQWIDEELIGLLSMKGPYSLLGSLIGLETSADFRSTAVTKCVSMSSETVLNVFKEFEDGEMTEDQFKNVLSADCVSKWLPSVFKDLSELGMIKMLPVNPLENKNLQVYRMPENDLMELLDLGFNSADREKIIWNRWTNSYKPSQYPNIINHPIWTRSFVWQTINFRNYFFIKESDITQRTLLIEFIGLNHQARHQIVTIEELIQRAYILISFVKLTEIEFKSTKSSNYLQKGLFKSFVSEIMKYFVKLNVKIKNIDDSSAARIGKLLDYVIAEPTGRKEQNPNEFFINFLNDSKGIEFGDLLLNIFCILFDQIEFITIENLKSFLKEFFERRPSIDSVIFVLRLFKDNLKEWKDQANSLLFEYLHDNMKYVMAIYKSSKLLLPNEIIQLVPLKIRYYENLKNRNVLFRRRPCASFELQTLGNQFVNDLGKFLEIVSMFAWYHVNLNQLIFYKDFSNEFKTFNLQFILQLYFRLFLKQRFLYELIGLHGTRPIIRILPLFPVELWYQLGHLLTRAILLKIPIPFIIDFEFFKAAFDPSQSESAIVSIQTVVEKSTGLLRELYTQMDADRRDWNNEKLKSKLDDLYQDLEGLRLFSESASRGCEFKTAEHPNLNARELIKHGLTTFAKGIKSGMNFDDFTIEETYNLIFYIE